MGGQRETLLQGEGVKPLFRAVVRGLSVSLCRKSIVGSICRRSVGCLFVWDFLRREIDGGFLSKISPFFIGTQQSPHYFEWYQTLLRPSELLRTN
jgi:hypothetical protein